MKKIFILLLFLPVVCLAANKYIFVNINDGAHNLGVFDGKTPIVFCATEYIPNKANIAAPIQCTVNTGIPLQYTSTFNNVDNEIKSNGKLVYYHTDLAKIVTVSTDHFKPRNGYKNNIQLCIRIRSRFNSPNPIPNPGIATVECKSIFSIKKFPNSIPLYHPF